MAKTALCIASYADALSKRDGKMGVVPVKMWVIRRASGILRLLGAAKLQCAHCVQGGRIDLYTAA